jgi:hypothetical protein
LHFVQLPERLTLISYIKKVTIPMSNSQHSFQFVRNEWLLFHQALNEITHGFQVSDFERTIGQTKSVVEDLLDHKFPSEFEGDLMLRESELRIVRNALRETMREHGIEEFQTRTGYDLNEGEAMLAKLDGLLGTKGDEE